VCPCPRVKGLVDPARRARPSRARGGPARRARTRHRTPGRAGHLAPGGRGDLAAGVRVRAARGPGRPPPPAGQVGWPTRLQATGPDGGVWTPGARRTGNFWKPRGHRPVWPVRSRQGPAARGSGLRSTHGSIPAVRLPSSAPRTGQILAAPPAKGPPRRLRLPPARGPVAAAGGLTCSPETSEFLFCFEFLFCSR
jgi:hypothetical protein